MKHLLLGLVLAMTLCFSLNAQVVLTTGTGTGAVGTNDPIWSVKLPGASNFISVPIMTGTLERPSGTLQPNTYDSDDCGRWISPFISSNNHAIHAPSIYPNPSDYVYRMEFDLAFCQSPQATLNLSFVASDNVISAIKVNGVPIPSSYLPTAYITFDPGVPIMNVPVLLTPGTSNSVEVVLNNRTEWTALQLCGEITLAPGNPPAPVDLGCCQTAAGQILSWTAINGAIGYNVYLTYNDQACCEAQGLPPMYEETFSTTDNGLMLPLITDCYSWRVRAVFPGGCQSHFSEPMCSCEYVEPPSCLPPTDLECNTEETGFFMDWSDVPGAQGYQVEITWFDPACCEKDPEDPLPTANLFPTQTSSINLPFSIGMHGCFSWKVRTQCDDGTFSHWTTAQCSCEILPPPCSPPTNYECEISGSNTLFLSWTGASNPVSYDIEVTWNDAFCCDLDPNNDVATFSNIFPSQVNNISITTGTFNNCFSWRVRTHCEDGTTSGWGPKECSCGLMFGPQKGNSDPSDEVEDADADIQVFVVPNPANDHVEFRLGSPSTEQETGRLTIVDLNERLVHSSIVDLSGTIKVDVQDLPAGMYLYTIENGSRSLNGKFVVKH